LASLIAFNCAAIDAAPIAPLSCAAKTLGTTLAAEPELFPPDKSLVTTFLVVSVMVLSFILFQADAILEAIVCAALKDVFKMSTEFFASSIPNLASSHFCF
jgi:hypothetical protein